MRYAGQSFELPVATDSLDPATFVPLFHATHQGRYGHSDTSRPVEVVNLRVKLLLPGPPIGATRSLHPRHTNSPTPAGLQDVWFEGETMRTAIYDRAELSPGTAFTGPAVATQMDSTTVLPPGWRAVADGWENLLLEMV